MKLRSLYELAYERRNSIYRFIHLIHDFQSLSYLNLLKFNPLLSHKEFAYIYHLHQ